jgi:hypothetical protein
MDMRKTRDADDGLTQTKLAGFFSCAWLRSQYDDEKR